MSWKYKLLENQLNKYWKCPLEFVDLKKTNKLDPMLWWRVTETIMLLIFRHTVKPLKRCGLLKVHCYFQ